MITFGKWIEHVVSGQPDIAPDESIHYVLCPKNTVDNHFIHCGKAGYLHWDVGKHDSVVRFKLRHDHPLYRKEHPSEQQP